jgi:hypothetical protein
VDDDREFSERLEKARLLAGDPAWAADCLGYEWPKLTAHAASLPRRPPRGSTFCPQTLRAHGDSTRTSSSATSSRTGTTVPARRLWEAASSAVAKRSDAKLIVLTTAGSPDHFAQVVEAATKDLRLRLGLSFTPGSAIDRPDEFRAAYAKVRDELESEPELRDLPLGHASIDEAEAKGELSNTQADLARRRERASEDLRRFTDLRVKIDGPVRLLDAEILTLAVSETRAARSELVGQTSGAAA